MQPRDGLGIGGGFLADADEDSQDAETVMMEGPALSDMLRELHTPEPAVWLDVESSGRTPSLAVRALPELEPAPLQLKAPPVAVASAPEPAPPEATRRPRSAWMVAGGLLVVIAVAGGLTLL